MAHNPWWLSQWKLWIALYNHPVFNNLVYPGELTLFLSLVLVRWFNFSSNFTLISYVTSLYNISISYVTSFFRSSWSVFWLCSTFCSYFSFQLGKSSIHLPKNNSANIWEELRYLRKSSPGTDRRYKNYWASRNVLTSILLLYFQSGPRNKTNKKQKLKIK